jgi:predicted dehydrogenase
MIAPVSGPLRIGILGTARIAGQFVAGVAASAAVTVTAVASRDGERAGRFAAQFGIPRSHASYAALLADAGVDAVYVPLPNALHAEWSIRAADAGKHVLCEKPLATSAADARAMFAAANRNGVALVEAYPYRAQPQILRLQELLREGAIGEVRLIQASFGFALRAGPNIRLDAELGGGALLDAGAYPVSFARMVAGTRPIRVQATALWSDGGVDRTLIAGLEYAGGLLAQIACSFDTAMHRQASIAGSGGLIQTHFLNHAAAAPAAPLILRRGVAWDAPAESVPMAPLNGFFAEAEAFARLVRGEAPWNGASAEESLDNTITLEALLASARSGQPFEIAAG